MGGPANRLFLHAVLGAPLMMIISYMIINQEAGYQVGWWAGEGPKFLVYLQGTPRLAQQRNQITRGTARQPPRHSFAHWPLPCCSLRSVTCCQAV